MNRRSLLKFLAVTPLFNSLNLRIPKTENVNIEKIDAKKDENKSDTEPEFDSIWSDLSAGDQLLIGGLPRMGKTSVALNILNEVSIIQNQPSAYFSLKSSTSELVERLLAIRTNIYLTKICKGSLDDRELDAIMLESKKISDAKIHFDDSTKDIDQVIKIVKSLKNKTPDLKYVFIDYLQLLTALPEGKDKIDYTNNLLTQLKKLAVEEKLIIITLAELKKSKELYASTPKIADFSDLTDFAHADQITLLNRWEYYYQERYKWKFYSDNFATHNDLLDFWTYKKKTSKDLLYFATIDLHSRRIHNFR